MKSVWMAALAAVLAAGGTVLSQPPRQSESAPAPNPLTENYVGLPAGFAPTNSGLLPVAVPGVQNPQEPRPPDAAAPSGSTEPARRRGDSAPAPVQDPENWTGLPDGFGFKSSEVPLAQAKPPVLDEDRFHPRISVSAEYLFWWLRDSPVPAPLLTTPSGSAPVGGINDLDYNHFTGLRFNAALWLDSCSRFGLEASAFDLEQRTASSSLNSDASGNPGLVRPLVDASTGQPLFVPVSIPGQLIGRLTASSSLDFGGAEANFTHRFIEEPWLSVDGLAGFRFAELSEKLEVDQLSQGVGTLTFPTNAFGALPAQSAFLVSDALQARTQFYGGQVGARAEFHQGILFLRLTGKVGVGETTYSLSSSGETAAFQPIPGTSMFATNQPSAFAPRGVLALPSNALPMNEHGVTVLSELGLNAGVQVMSHLRVVAGYTLLYWGDVVRPGNQLSNVVNSLQVPLAVSPAGAHDVLRPLPLTKTDLWANGLNCGLEVTW
jgi:Putative beta barrel porin-7 (BBP7)